MLPANTGPADIPIPKSTRSGEFGPRARAVASAPMPDPRAQGGAEDRERGIALKLVDQTAFCVDFVDNDPEEIVEHRGDFMGLTGCRQLRRTHQIDEQDRDLALVAGNRFVRFDSATDHLFADVTAEQVTQLVTFPQSGDPAVESRLQVPEFFSLIHVDHFSEVSASEHPPSRR